MNNIIGQNIRRLRKREGLTQAALADALGCADYQVSNWETGRFLPSLRYMRALADAFAVTVDALMLAPGPES